MLYLLSVMHQRAPHPRRGATARSQSRWRSGIVVIAVALALLSARVTTLWSHEIPERVAIRAYVQPDGQTLRVLLRVPVEAMRDVEFPLRDDGTLDLVRVRGLLSEATQLWLINSIRITADGTTLDAPRIAGARIALPNDRSFDSFAAARAHFELPLLETERIVWQQTLLDVALEYPLPSTEAALVLHPDLAHLGIRTTSVVHVIGADGADRVLTYDGNPDAIALEPSWFSTFAQFFREGFRHILGGIDHLLFVICLVLPVRRWQSLLTVVTAFTVAHSLTLGTAVLGFAPTALWFPPLVETLIAASIVWLTVENIVLSEDRLAERWPLAFAFGLVHGFGFSFALGETLQFAGGNLVSALAAFNIGVELGQIAVLSLAVPLLWLARRYVTAPRERLVTIVASALVAHTAWHWMAERGADLMAHRASFSWPALDGTLALSAMRAALLAAVAIAVALAMRQILGIRRRS